MNAETTAPDWNAAQHGNAEQTVEKDAHSDLSIDVTRDAQNYTTAATPSKHITGQYAHGHPPEIVRRNERADGRTLWSAYPSTVVPYWSTGVWSG
jgi:hypothetical protein